MKKILLDVMMIGILSVGVTAPALAGKVPAPAPLAGIGVGAAIIIGIGYRALRKRIDR